MTGKVIGICRKIGWQKILCVLTFLTVTCLPSLVAAQGPKYGGTLRVGIDGTIGQMNPYRARYRQHFSYARFYAEGLVDFNKNAEIVPGLAESWKISNQPEHKRNSSNRYYGLRDVGRRSRDNRRRM